VDSLIVTDMIALARNRAISDAVLVSGDEDLQVGVQQAQEFGVRVHLIGIKPSRGSQSLFLLQEADTTHEWSNDEISVFLRCQPVQIPADPRPTPAASGTVPVQVQDPLKGVAVRVVARLELTEIQALVETVERMGQIPRDIDKQLLGRSARGNRTRPKFIGKKGDPRAFYRRVPPTEARKLVK
jgi:hypothetical protein